MHDANQQSDVWQLLKDAVRESGVRVDERLALLERLGDPAEFGRLGERLEAAVARFEGVAQQLRREARGR